MSKFGTEHRTFVRDDSSIQHAIETFKAVQRIKRTEIDMERAELYRFMEALLQNPSTVNSWGQNPGTMPLCGKGMLSPEETRQTTGTGMLPETRAGGRETELAAFLETLNETELNLVKELLGGTAKETGYELGSDLSTTIPSTGDEERIHQHILEYQNNNNCRYDQAADVILSQAGTDS